jgi:hypothetical protein
MMYFGLPLSSPLACLYPRRSLACAPLPTVAGIHLANVGVLAQKVEMNATEVSFKLLGLIGHVPSFAPF